MPVTSADRGGVFGGRGADTAACKIKRRQKPTMNDDYTIPYRVGRRPGEQGPRPLPSNQGRVEKLATGQHVNTRYTTENTQRLKPIKNTLTASRRRLPHRNASLHSIWTQLKTNPSPLSVPVTHKKQATISTGQIFVSSGKTIIRIDFS